MVNTFYTGITRFVVWVKDVAKDVAVYSRLKFNKTVK